MTQNESAVYPKIPQSATLFKDRYQLLWKGGLSKGDSTVFALNFNNKRSKMKEGKDHMIRSLLNESYTQDILLTLRTPISLVSEYTPQIENIVNPTATFGGQSVVSFGSNVKQVNMKLTVVKTPHKTWISYLACLEAMTILSGNPKYFGNLFLIGYDADSEVHPRRYKVVIKSMATAHRADKNNFVDVDLNLIVKYDYSLARTNRDGQFGRL